MASILWRDHGPVRLITINRPDQMNSLDFAANAELVDVWRAFETDDSVRVAVITGAGEKAFCAGADLKTYTMNFAQRGTSFACS
jgi:enoyl-CoA hydratase/carnithine racemase